ncbi:response regulator transcription factor [Streptomyces sp. NPDC056549]|uniref:response regulator transcription factor n=1 Tax=Streptomyces sp. NPDC056549 TaxID=3345864 RepID=UPI00368F7C12
MTLPIAAPTQRERDVVAYVAEGWANDEIGVALNLAPSTVARHLQIVSARYRVTTREALVDLSLARGYIRPPDAGPSPGFSEKEMQLIRLVAADYRLPAISAAMGMSKSTALRKLTNARSKAGARGNAHLIALCFAWGLLPVAREAVS